MLRQGPAECQFECQAELEFRAEATPLGAETLGLARAPLACRPRGSSGEPARAIATCSLHWPARAGASRGAEADRAGRVVVWSGAVWVANEREARTMAARKFLETERPADH